MTYLLENLWLKCGRNGTTKNNNEKLFLKSTIENMQDSHGLLSPWFKCLLRAKSKKLGALIPMMSLLGAIPNDSKTIQG